MRIIPAIDVIDGKCVRLSKGDYDTKKIYADDPVEMAKRFEDSGIQYLHLVDLNGAKSNKVQIAGLIEAIATQTKLIVDFGGGIKTEDDVKIAFESGANQITVGSVALNNPLMFYSWLKEYGSDKIILGADCKDRQIMTQGWLKGSKVDVVAFISEYMEQGVSTTIVTDIDKDGMLSGPAFELYNEIMSKTGVDLIASGGITTIADVLRLREMGCEGAIIGKAIYEGTITLKQLSELC
ncbi:1-(5-phosphoribosyl)-5-[(5-phosphoribosylamino)methylideneamino]imidazole-4-carboxamide isomerase [Myroides phaeus]|uniref:1-(5-phosphoribosyl)-5-[(5- phosphoribosylamino)methylideneamino]imidazole-4- carboxamide isomerase n=1 Tax=Myroides phaeus TaxID=702745 RepID=UPI002DBA141E|nr:1-(5-phosphoribosyl)-5-[(5-phosphoribosylamino)methylideneamino]imidazole-4-carboxamide isomerase [Myroides phaeus]MEC4117443.1 1-(5-phosphoribosyl)-5-[(5-phosphoribosylamino)methylideneamino]imidazole-4-carboxamide isomerase [Myroides phaeus]